MAQDIKQLITDSIISKIESGSILPWRKPWVNGLNKNPETGTVYKPLNQFILAEAGFSDNRWYTAKWCKENGISFKGAKLSLIVGYFDIADKAKNDEAADEDSQEVAKQGGWSRRITRVGVFNAEQLPGIQPLNEALGLPPFRSDEIIEELAAQMMANGLRIDHGGQKAYYSPSEDRIVLPRRDLFLSSDDYYSTLLHEIIHSTGHPSRLNRPQSGRFGSDAYAFEELVAETGSAITLASFRGATGQTTFEQNVSYIAGWSRIFKADKGAYFLATKEAYEAFHYLNGLMPEQILIARAENAVIDAVQEAPKRVYTPSF